MMHVCSTDFSHIALNMLKMFYFDNSANTQWPFQSLLFSGQASLLFSLSLVLWASWKELKEQVCYTACPEKDVEEFHLNIYFSKGQVNLYPHLSHRQKKLVSDEWTPCFSHPAFYRSFEWFSDLGPIKWRNYKCSFLQVYVEHLHAHSATDCIQ